MDDHRPEPVLEAVGVSFGYGHLPVVKDLSLTVGKGEIVALLGANGAGKTTTMLGLAGVVRAFGGETRFDSAPARHSLHRRARSGLSFVPAERPVVRSLTVRENLRIGRGGVDRAVSIFPELGPHSRSEGWFGLRRRAADAHAGTGARR